MMYRSGSSYDEMAKLVIDVYLDYGFNTFPLDVNEVCRKLGISLVPYSAFNTSEQELLKKRSNYGFFNPMTASTPPMIFFNDNPLEICSKGCMRQTIFHEIKHYVNEDSDEIPDDDDLAEYFGKYFAAPIPYLVIHKITNPGEIVSHFGTSYEMAGYISSNVKNRMRRYGTKLFDYEKPLIKQLEPVYYDIYIEAEEVVPNESKLKTY